MTPVQLNVSLVLNTSRSETVQGADRTEIARPPSTAEACALHTPARRAVATMQVERRRPPIVSVCAMTTAVGTRPRSG